MSITNHGHSSRRLTLMVIGIFVGIVVLSLAIALFVAQGARFGVPVPKSWTLTQESGKISRICFGGWEECGTIDRTYETHQSPEAALGQLQTTLTGQGWVLNVGSNDPNPIEATAKNKAQDWDQIGYVELADGVARIKYVRR